MGHRELRCLGAAAQFKPSVAYALFHSPAARRRRRTLAGSSTSSRLHSFFRASTASSAADMIELMRSSTAGGAGGRLSASAPNCSALGRRPALTRRLQAINELQCLRHGARAAARRLLRRLILRNGLQREPRPAPCPGHGGSDAADETEGKDLGVGAILAHRI